MTRRTTSSQSNADELALDAERRRAGVMRRLSLLDSLGQSDFDDIVAFAATQLRTPMAAVSLTNTDRLWFASSIGLGLTQISREGAFCDAVITGGEELVVADASKDHRFSAISMVTQDPFIRFYAGVPIRVSGEFIGSMCVLDVRPREPDEAELATLRFLGRQVEHLIELHGRRSAELPPSREAVIRLANRVAQGEDLAAVLGEVERAAWMYDAASLRIIDVNQVAVDRYGWTREEFQLRTMLDLSLLEERGVLSAVMADGSMDTYSASRLWRHHRADRELIDVKLTVAPTVHKRKPARLVVVTDVTTQVALSDALERAAHVDSLTGLANRRQFIRTLGEQLTTCPDRVAVFFIDLDRFKMVNDTMGHEAGDALLGAAAARILACTPSVDLVARLGGDEFAVIQGVATTVEAKTFAERVRSRLEHPFIVDGCEYYVSASVGVAVSSPSSTPQSLLAEADAAMYAAKDAGRNGSALFDSELRQRMTEWSEVQRDLHHAIDGNELELDFQPIIDFSGGDVAYETLARWNHPTRGRLLPATFIDVAEESGLINRLGAYLLALGATYAAQLDVALSVNVSVRQFNRTLVQQVSGLISRHGLRPGQLILEVTESAVVDTDHARIVLDGLRDAGASVWIDDFGTGFSSLARLNSLTVDGLKLPREFVATLDSAQGWGIATAIVGIARALDIRIIAEGVETERQLEQVRTLGCDAAQGYLIGRPEPFGKRASWPLRGRLFPAQTTPPP